MLLEWQTRAGVTLCFLLGPACLGEAYDLSCMGAHRWPVFLWLVGPSVEGEAVLGVICNAPKSHLQQLSQQWSWHFYPHRSASSVVPGREERDATSWPAQTPAHVTTKLDITLPSFWLKRQKGWKLFLLVGLDFGMAIYRGRRVRGESRCVVVCKSGVELSEEVCQHCQMLLKVKKNADQEKAIGCVDEK